MADQPERLDTVAASPIIDGPVGDVSRDSGHPSSPGPSDGDQTISLLEETAVLSKRRVVTGSLKIETRTEFRHENAELFLDRRVVDITRVPMNRLIEDAPEVRTEGDTTIVPVVEERFVVVKQIFLKEELHIRHRMERETFEHSVALRRQSAVVERFDSEGRIIDPGNEPESRQATPATN